MIITACILSAITAFAADGECVITTLADFEDDAVATFITDAVNAPLADCRARMTKIPARGQRCLQIEIGAIQPRASAACDLRFRVATPFSEAEHVATYAWVTQGSADLLFRIRDARGHVYESEALPLQTRNRWVRLVADLTPAKLKRVGKGAVGDSTAPAWPIEILGYRIQAAGTGRQVVFVDDLEVEHHAVGAGILRGDFQFNEPTRIYPPGSLVRAEVVLENISRRNALPLSINLSWRTNDGAELARTPVSISLPPSGGDYRSRQAVDFSQTIAEPGLYHLVAEVRGPLWNAPAVLQTTIAVTFPNRDLPRGRSTFFGMQSNLLREPAGDQRLELDIARDLGVQLLALETPWRMFEPKEGRFDFEALDTLLDRLTRMDMAVLLIVVEPPDWAARDAEKLWKQQSNFIAAVTKRCGEKLYGFRPLAPAPGVLTELDLRALDELAQQLALVRRSIALCAPPILVSSDTPKTTKLPPLPADPPYELAFETRGNPEVARSALQALAQAHGLRWSAKFRWFHVADGLNGSGGAHDAVAMLHHFVQAAREGVGGVVWCDLRDDTNDPRLLDQMRGLVQRDFSPKNALIGFANVVGVLNGLMYAGALPGTPPEFDSSLFLGGARQVAVLCPKPNRVLPAAISPYQIVDGELIVFDFDRRALSMGIDDAPPLVETQPRPLFISLAAREAQSAPQIGLAIPWLEAPRTVYCDKETTFRIRLRAPQELRRGYLQLNLPDDAPLKSSLSSRALRAAAGETLDFDVTLTRTGDFQSPITCPLRVSLEGRIFQIPIEIRPHTYIDKLSDAGDLLGAERAIGALAAPANEDNPANAAAASGRRPAPAAPRSDTAACRLYAGYQDRKLYLAVALPPRMAPDARLYVGLAAENGDEHVELCVEDLASAPRLLPTGGTAADQLLDWRCEIVESASRKYCRISISPRGLDRATFESDARLLLSVRYEEPAPAAWSRPYVLEWGSGLVGERTTSEYRGVALGR